MQELDYAEMLEIPVSTVNVTKKRSLFRRREQDPREELKERVVDSVNERVGAFVEAEDLSDPPAQKPNTAIKSKSDRQSIILFSEIAAVCVIAMAIFLTNIFMPNSAINTFISSLINPEEAVIEPTYNQFTLNSVVSEYSDADIVISDEGVMSFIAQGSIYPVCDGKIQTVSLQSNGTYVVKINHSATFSSVVTGLTNVYTETGGAVHGNLPFAYSNGEGEVTVSLYNGEELLNCLTLSGEVPVWKS